MGSSATGSFLFGKGLEAWEGQLVLPCPGLGGRGIGPQVLCAGMRQASGRSLSFLSLGTPQ